MPDTPMTDASTPETPPLPNLLSRAIGIITSPGAMFVHVVRTPKVAGMLFLIAVVTSLAVGIPQLTERGQDAMLEMMRQQGSSDQAFEQIERLSQSGMLAYISMVNIVVFVPLMAVVITAVLWAVFNTVMGGTATFKQVMAVLVHAQVVSLVGSLFAAPIIYARGVMSSGGVANLGVLLPMLDERSFLAKFLGMVDLFNVWAVVVLSIGLATLYKRKTSSIATGLFVFYGIFALTWAYFTAG